MYVIPDGTCTKINYELRKSVSFKYDTYFLGEKMRIYKSFMSLVCLFKDKFTIKKYKQPENK